MPKTDEVVDSPPSVLVKLAHEYAAAREEVEELEAKLKLLKEKKESSGKQLVDEMITQGVKAFKTEDIGGFRTQSVVYPNVKDKELLNAYVIENKLDWLYSTTVNGTKLKSWVKELMEENKKIPPGIDPYVTTEIRRF